MRILRIVWAIPLLFFAGLCVPGFLASFEPGPLDEIFRVVYPVLCLGSLGAAVWLILKKPRVPDLRSAHGAD